MASTAVAYEDETIVKGKHMEDEKILTNTDDSLDVDELSLEDLDGIAGGVLAVKAPTNLDREYRGNPEANKGPYFG